MPVRRQIPRPRPAPGRAARGCVTTSAIRAPGSVASRSSPRTSSTRPVSRKGRTARTASTARLAAHSGVSSPAAPGTRRAWSRAGRRPFRSRRPRGSQPRRRRRPRRTSTIPEVDLGRERGTHGRAARGRDVRQMASARRSGADAASSARAQVPGLGGPCLAEDTSGHLQRQLGRDAGERLSLEGPEPLLLDLQQQPLRVGQPLVATRLPCHAPDVLGLLLRLGDSLGGLRLRGVEQLARLDHAPPREERAGRALASRPDVQGLPTVHLPTPGEAAPRAPGS